MDKQYIEDNEIGIKYLRQQLTPEEAEAFEIYLMENPEALEQIETDAVLHDGSKRINRSLEASDTNSGRAQQRFNWFPQNLRGHTQSFVLGCIVATIAFNFLPIKDTQDSRYQGESAQMGYFSPLRSLASGQQATDLVSFVKGGDDKPDVVLVIDIGAFDQKYYDLELMKGEDLVKPFRVKPDQEGSIVVLVPQHLLEIGRYTMRVKHGGGDERFFEFDVTE